MKKKNVTGNPMKWLWHPMLQGKHQTSMWSCQKLDHCSFINKPFSTFILQKDLDEKEEGQAECDLRLVWLYVELISGPRQYG
jgi:hypothetical protein